MPAAIAIVPSNGPVASTSRATPSPGSGGDAFLQLLCTADNAAAEQGAVRADAGQTEAAAQPADAGPPAMPAKPEAEGAGASAVKTGRPAKTIVAAEPAAAAATDTSPAGIVPLPADVPPPMAPEPQANQAALPQGAAAVSNAETTTAGPAIADGRPHQDAAAITASPVSAAEASGSAAPAETSRTFRVIAPAAEQPAQTTAAPSGPAIMPSVFPPEPTATAATVSAPVAPAHASPAAATPPAAQIGSGPLTLGPAADGSQQMTLRLHPAELGVVQVQIGRSDTGAAHVEITAEKADTLQALLRDQPQLHRALDDAGVPAAGRAVTFHAAPI